MEKIRSVTSLDTVRQSKESIVSDMNGEKVMFSVEKGKYYNLGDIGGVIWDHIESPVTVNQIISSLIGSYDISKEHCEEEVINFLSKLLDEELIYKE